MSVLATIAMVWRAKKIGSKLKGFFSDPKVLLSIVLIAIITYLVISGHYKSLKITNLKVDVSSLEQKNASLEASITEQNAKIEIQNSAVEEYEKKTNDLRDRIVKLNRDVQKARLETQEILTKYNNAPSECSAALNWVVDELQSVDSVETEGAAQ